MDSFGPDAWFKGKKLYKVGSGKSGGISRGTRSFKENALRLTPYISYPN